MKERKKACYCYCVFACFTMEKIIAKITSGFGFSFGVFGGAQGVHGKREMYSMISIWII